MATRMYVCESTEHSSSLLSGLNEQRLKATQEAFANILLIPRVFENTMVMRPTFHGLLCDITVRVQGHLFKAHVNVLASTMGYFRDLFLKSGKVKAENIIEIPIIVNSTGFAKILDFVYTSQLCLSQSTVMQVLCSSCYLQIPYVVEKCQEFISTHGHVTSQASLSEVTVPLLQNLQQKALVMQNQKPNASLSLLSQLNRLSKTSQNGLPRQPESAGSPQELQEMEESQESALVHIPPSPEMRASSNGDDNKSGNSDAEKSEEALQACNMITLKREREVATSPSEDRHVQSSYSPPHYLQNGFDDGPMSKKFMLSDSSNNQPLDLVANTISGERDVIDHKSLAEYFSTESERKSMLSAGGLSVVPYSFHTDPRQNGFSDSTRHIALTSRKSMIKSRLLGNMTSSRTFTIKKDKPKKEYRCEYCDKLFGRQQHLKRHILTHTGERPYPCTLCEKRFRRSEHLKHHLLSHEANADGLSSRKKPKKTARCSDAYDLSKIMLERTGQAESNAEKPSTNGSLISVPVVLPSMFTEADRINENSDTSQIVGPNDQVKVEHDDLKNGFPTEQIATSEDNQQSETALNLCTGSPKDNGHFQSDMTSHDYQEMDGPIENGESGSFDENPENQTSPASSSQLYPVENGIGLMDENPIKPGLMGMEGSEVLTSDLKRLIAAMDQ